MTDQRDAVAAFDVQVQVLEHDERVVGLAHVLHLEHGASALRADREVEMNLLPLCRHLDGHHLLEHLDPTLHLRRLRRLVAKPVDEHLDARHLLVLLALRLAHLFDARFVGHEVIAVVAHVVGERPKREVGDARHHRVQKETVV